MLLVLDLDHHHHPTKADARPPQVFQTVITF
jgi:hypothetical protein